VRRVVLAAELSGFVAGPDGGERGPRPACGVHPSGSVSRIRLSSRLVSSPSGVRSPGVVVQGSGGPAVWCPLVQRPAVCCPLRPSGRVRPSHPTPGGGVGGPSRGGGQPAHGNGARSVGGRAVGRLGRRPRRLGGRRCRGRAWVSGVSVADPGRVGSGRCAERPSLRLRCGQGNRLQREVAAPAAWLPSSAGCATTVRGRRRA
jgi:hypothetical protein